MQKPFVLGAIAAVLSASSALAQTPAPAPAAPEPEAGAAAAPASGAALGGPVVAGVCLLSRDQMFAQSLVGQAAVARLKELGQRAQNNLDAEKRKIETDYKALQTQGPTMAPQQAQQKQRQLQARAQGLQDSAARTQREMEATRAKALERIQEAAQPVIQAAYQAKGCGLLVAREAVLGGNLANDITPAVVQGLNAKMTTITFERERLPASAASR
ncbi:MAG TPA: OmpH family outer membrane protein [Caulobacteraceae bacterium]|jgi:Skp family chaperone for outer membrane proteins|nr:OmpH family outer membrane protein [Caulobacteraceae bacterium]